MHKNFIYQITSQQIKILIGNKKKKNERTYVFDFFPLLHSAISCRKPGKNVQSLLETSKFALKSSQEISGAERRFVPGANPADVNEPRTSSSRHLCPCSPAIHGSLGFLPGITWKTALAPGC